MPTSEQSMLRIDLERRRARLGAALEQEPCERLEKLLSQVDHALEHVKAGDYGICKTCHEAIGDAQLAAFPLLDFCIEHLTPAEQQNLERALELASRIQSHLLPERRLTHAGWEAYYHYEPAGPVGGDYCDLVTPRAEAVYFFLGDAASKGVAASLLTAQLYGLVRTLVALDLPLTTMLECANRVFCEMTLPSLYATLVAGRALEGGAVELVNAGHPAPLLLRDGEALALESTGQPLGLLRDATYQARRINLEPGQTLLLFTDGFSEAESPASVEYGVGRAARVAATRHGRGAEALVRDCLDDWNTFRGGASRTDDLTLMALRRSR
jgi:sigma-B regulation protein RsbU (phosphoserine phosphatase)